ncbi:MAG TPA: hypothetical protein VGM19_01575 [Armatimonadota bacterium]|jgi:hypothetical protein
MTTTAARFPDHRSFAFSIFDDTDLATEANVGPVYRLLADLGVRATKSVWPLACVPEAPLGGETLQDGGYLRFIRWLQAEGFEIGFHNARNFDAPRELTRQGLDTFAQLLGAYPRTHCNHEDNRDNLYWGADRLRPGLLRAGYNLATRGRYRRRFEGHLESSPYFWGDLCREHVDYVRNFVFGEINLDRLNPTLPYHDPAKPYVKAWFSSSEGGTVDSFCRLLSEANQDRLEAEGGVCIVYTHFAKGFSAGGEVHPQFAALLRRLARRPGWFVPVATLLDHLQAGPQARPIPNQELRRMERAWFSHKLRHGAS